MHMTCRQCHHEFCWLCMGDWKIHNDRTGGFYSCNLYKPSQDDSSDEEKLKAELLKRLEFFMDRYYEQKKSYTISQSDLIKITEKLHPGNGEENILSKFNDEHFGELEFYLEAYSYLLLCRNFVLHTYPSVSGLLTLR